MIIEKDKISDNKSNIWNEILTSAYSKKDLEESNVFIFGDKFTGKRNLVKAMNKELLQYEDKKILTSDESVSKYGLLDYTYLNIKKIIEQDADSIGKMNIWIANDIIDKDAFEAIIKPEHLLKSVCVVVVDLSRPWEIIENLKKWMILIYECFSNILLKFPLDKQQELRQSIIDYIKLYEEPSFDEEANYILKEALSDESLNLRLQLPLKEGVLKTNMGIPLIFVVNKSDIVLQAAERRRFEEDSEFIFKHIRKFALGYGASIIYTSTKQNINLNILYEYILHRIYKFDLRYKPNTVNKDSYFIPAGYDAVSILASFDLQEDLKTPFDDRITPIKQKNQSKEEEIVCEDLNTFLKKFIDKGTKQDDKSKTSEYRTENTANKINDNPLNKLKNKQNENKDKVDFGIFKQSTLDKDKEKLEQFREKTKNELFSQSTEVSDKFKSKLNLLKNKNKEPEKK